MSRLLRRLLSRQSRRIVPSIASTVTSGQALFEHAGKLTYEGIISKRARAPYRSGRTEAWATVKTVRAGKFPVTGFIKDPSGVAEPADR